MTFRILYAAAASNPVPLAIIAYNEAQSIVFMCFCPHMYMNVIL